MTGRRSGRLRSGAALLSIVVALPAGVSLRDLYDRWTGTYPTVTAASSPLVDGRAEERELNRFVLTTSVRPRRLVRNADLEQVVAIGRDHVAVATRLSRRQAAALPDVRAVERDEVASFFSADPAYPSQWPLENTGQTGGLAGADIRWPVTRGHSDGAGTTVAVIDSGIDFTHEDLAAAQWRNSDEICDNRADDDANGYVDDCAGWDFVNNDNRQYDLVTAGGAPADNAHGTHIAGTIAATADNGTGVAGVAPGTKIMALKVGENGSFPHSRLVLAIDYAIANGADVINASWGGSSSSSFLEAAVRRADQAGVLFVAAAGNEGSNNDVSPRYPSGYDAGAVVSVGASTHGDAPAYFSNYGTSTVDVFAPGERILATLPGNAYAYMSGTSMAAPHVAAVAALIKSQRPGISTPDLKATILRTARRLDSLVGRAVSGARLDAATALGIPPGGVAYRFTGFDRFTAGAANAAAVTVSVSQAGVLPPVAELGVRGTLGVLHDGAVRGVVGHPVNGSPTDIEASLSLSNGALDQFARDALLSPAGLTLPVETTLPPGRYAVLVELVDQARTPAVVIGSSQAVLFQIADPSAPVDPPPGGSTPPPGSATPPPTGGTPAPATPPPGSTSPAPAPTPRPVATSTPAPPGASPPPPGGSTPPPGGSAPSPVASPAPTPRPPAGSTPAPAPAQPAPAPTSTASPSPLAPKPVPPPIVPPAPSVPADPGPAPASSYRLTPNVATTSGGTLVEIRASGLPWGAYVHFGGSPGYVLYQDSEVIYVMTPAHLPGTVDVELVRNGNRLVLPNAFTFKDPQQPSAPPPGSTTPPPGSTPAPGATPPPGSTPPPGTTSPPPAPAPGATPPPGGRTVGQPSPTPRGLLVIGLAKGHPLARLVAADWDRHGCRETQCPGLSL